MKLKKTIAAAGAAFFLATSAAPAFSAPVTNVQADVPTITEGDWDERRVTVNLDIFGLDDEWFRDETIETDRQMTFEVSGDEVTDKDSIDPVRWGGECRLEIDMKVTMKDSEGNLTISGELRLYEGTSTNTGDLDGVREFSFTLPANQKNRTKTYTVNNVDEGGDYATVKMAFTNQKS